jgi:hypothetical protein
LVAVDLEQASISHGDDVEGAESTIGGADVGEGDPLIAGGKYVVGLESDRKVAVIARGRQAENAQRDERSQTKSTKPTKVV